VIRSLIGDVVLLGAGHGMLRLAAKRGRWPFGFVGGIGVSFLAGSASLGVLVTLAGVGGISTKPFPYVAPPLLALGVAGVVIAAGAGRPARPTAATFAGGIAAVATSWIAVAASHMIVRLNDEYSIWALKGRALALLGTLDLRLFAEPRPYWYAHLEYPMLVPGLVAWSDGWTGRVADGPAHVQVVLVFGALLAVVAWAVARLAGPAAAALAVILAVAVHGVAATSILVYADVPVCSFAVATVLLLAVWHEMRDRAVLVAATATAAGAMLTKNEGLLFVVAAFIAIALVARGGRTRLVVAFGVALVAWVPWFAFVHAHHLHDADLDFGALTRLGPRLDRLRVIVHGLRHYWPAFGWTGVGVFLAATAVALFGGRVRLAVQWLVTITVALIGLSVIYLIERLTLPGLLATTASRVELFPAVTLAVGVPLLAGAATRPSAPAAPEDASS